MSNLHSYWRKLSVDQQAIYAVRAGLSPKYIENHLIHKRKTPRLPALKALANASDGELTLHGLVDFFVEDAEQATA